jgi:hypothetical protein
MHLTGQAVSTPQVSSFMQATVEGIAEFSAYAAFTRFIERFAN